MPHVLLVDGTAYLFRCYYASPPRLAPDGTPVHAVHGLAYLLRRLVEKAAPSHAAVAFDAGAKTFRTELYPPYKSDRGAPPADLVPQFELAPEVCRALGLATAIAPGFEADDVLATLATRAARAGWQVTIVTADKDLAQLVSERITLWECVKDERAGPAEVERRFGVRPDQLADLQALAGDSTDHFPGLRGVGPSTAAKLLRHAGSLAALLADPDLALTAQIRNAAVVARRLREEAESVRLFLKLSTLRSDVELPLGSADLLHRGPDRALAEPLFRRLGMQAMLGSAPAHTGTRP